jgi:hypothetical protein
MKESTVLLSLTWFKLFVLQLKSSCYDYLQILFHLSKNYEKINKTKL